MKIKGRWVVYLPILIIGLVKGIYMIPSEWYHGFLIFGFFMIGTIQFIGLIISILTYRNSDLNIFKCKEASQFIEWNYNYWQFKVIEIQNYEYRRPFKWSIWRQVNLAFWIGFLIFNITKFLDKHLSIGYER